VSDLVTGLKAERSKIRLNACRSHSAVRRTQRAGQPPAIQAATDERRKVLGGYFLLTITVGLQAQCPFYVFPFFREAWI